MKAFLKILKGLGITLLALIMILSSLILAVVKWPQILLNGQSLRAIAGLSERFGFHVDWDSERIQVDSVNFNRKKILLSFKGLDFSTADGGKRAAFKRLDAGVEFEYKRGRFRILEVGPVIADGQLFLDLKKSAAKPKKDANQNRFEIKVPDIVLPDFMKEALFRTIFIDLSRVEARREGRELFLGSAALAAEPDARGRLTEVLLQAAPEDAFKFKKGELVASVKSASGFVENDWRLKAVATLETKAGDALEATAEAFKNERAEYSYRLDSSVAKGQMKIEARAEGVLGASEWNGKIQSTVEGLGHDIRSVSTENCAFSIRSAGDESRQVLDLRCPVRVRMTPFQRPPMPYRAVGHLPSQFEAVLTSQVEAEILPTPQLDRPLSGNVKVELVSFSQKFATASGNAQTRFKGVPSQYPEGWEFLTDLDLNLAISRFRQLVGVLHRTDFAIPAPVNALDGSVQISLQGRANLTRQNGEVPLTFKTRLSSTGQKVHTDGKGKLAYQYSKNHFGSNLAFDLRLSDVQLILPTLGYSPPPQLVPDNRIRTPESGKKSKGGRKSMNYEVRIRTPDNPVKVTTNLLNSPIPVDLDLRLREGKMGGTVRVAPTAIEFFRRRAQVREVKISLEDPTKLSEVSGLVQINYTHYLINVMLLGTLDRTKVVLESKPDLSEDEIISLLIYGRTYDDLSQTEAESASNASQAFLNRAVGLSTFFLLSATPIERIEYNPDNGTFAAQFRLGKGASFSVGTTENQGERVGIKKTIGGNWIINTYVENDPEERKQTGSGFLEWVKRY